MNTDKTGFKLILNVFEDEIGVGLKVLVLILFLMGKQKKIKKLRRVEWEILNFCRIHGNSKDI